MTRSEQADLAVITEIVSRIEARQESDARIAREIAADVADLHRKSDDMARRLGAVEPVTQMVTSWHARVIGATMVLGFLGAVVGLLFAMVRDKLAAMWGVLWG